MSNLFDTFKEAIENATTKWEQYKQRENTYKGKVNQGLDELRQLIDRLKACIDKLVALQDDYSSYIQRIIDIRINMQAMLDEQITQITNRSGEDCDEKIRELLEKFQGFVNTIGEWEGDASRFEGLLAELKTEIDRLCNKADEIIAKNEENRGGLDQELTNVEEAMGVSKAETKRGETTREQKLARLAQIEAELERRQEQAELERIRQEQAELERRRQEQQQQQRRQARQFSTSTPDGFNREQSRQRKINELRRTDMSREDKISEMRSWDRDNGFGAIAKDPTAYNNLFESGVQRGGWQTPEKLESISRYSPIRRVTRKKNKKKKKNTKKNKKNKRKRNKRKQTKRRGKKRN